MKNENLNNIYENGSKLGLDKKEIKNILEYKTPNMVNDNEKTKLRKKNELYCNKEAIYGPGYYVMYGSVSIKDFN